MAVTTRVLEKDSSYGKGMHPLQVFRIPFVHRPAFFSILTDKNDGQILFARMSITVVLSLAYLWWAKIPHAPFGKKEVRVLLVVRGLSGFLGGESLSSSMMCLTLLISSYSIRTLL